MLTIDQLKEGTRVLYRPNFGNGSQIIGTVTNTAMHKGQPVVDMVGHTWAYLHQVDGIYDA